MKLDLNDEDVVSILDEIPFWSASFGIELLEKIKLLHGINALDIGCGTGFPLLEVAQRLGNTSNVYGIDPYEKALDRVRLKIKTMGITNTKLFAGKAENMPFEDRFFNLIVSNNGLNNVEDQRKVLSECFRVCRPDAQMVLTMNLPETMIEFYSVYEETLNEFGLSGEISNLKEHIAGKRQPISATSVLLHEAGFEINEVSQKEFNYRFADGTAMLNYYLIKLAFLEPWKSVIRKEDIERVFSFIEIKLNDIAGLKGELRLKIPFVSFDCRKH